MAGAAVKAGYRRSIDLMRILAAFGIVWDHARAPYADVGYLALSLFLVLSSYLAIGSFERSGARNDAQNFWLIRARRVMLPWLFWCVVYRATWEVVSDAPFQLLSEPLSILIGPSIHLWFLPFVMLALIVVPILSLSIRDGRGLFLACLLLIAVAVPLGWLHARVGIWGWLFTDAALPPPLPQWFFSLPLFLFGGLLAVADRLGMRWMVLVTAGAVSGALFLLAPEFPSVQMALTAVVFLAFWNWNITGRWPTVLAGFAFGVYVLHPAAMLVGFKLFGPDLDRSLGALFAFALSVALTAVMQRLPFLRQMV